MVQNPYKWLNGGLCRLFAFVNLLWTGRLRFGDNEKACGKPRLFHVENEKNVENSVEKVENFPDDRRFLPFSLFYVENRSVENLVFTYF